MNRRWIGRWLVGSLVGLVVAGSAQRAEAYTIDIDHSLFTARATARVGNDSQVDVDADSFLALSLAVAIGDTAAGLFTSSSSQAVNQSNVIQGIDIRGSLRTSTRLRARYGPGSSGPEEKATAGATGMISFTTHKSRPGEIDELFLELFLELTNETTSDTFPFSYMVTDVTSGEVLFDSASSGFESVVFLPAKVGDQIRVNYSGFIEISNGRILSSLRSTVEVRDIVPEPGTGILTCLGLATLGWTRRRFEHRE